MVLTPVTDARRAALAELDALGTPDAIARVLAAGGWGGTPHDPRACPLARFVADRTGSASASVDGVSVAVDGFVLTYPDHTTEALTHSLGDLAVVEYATFRQALSPLLQTFTHRGDSLAYRDLVVW